MLLRGGGDNDICGFFLGGPMVIKLKDIVLFYVWGDPTDQSRGKVHGNKTIANAMSSSVN
jgi:hypothetical protein